jgi:hypothetical protein
MLKHIQLYIFIQYRVFSLKSSLYIEYKLDKSTEYFMNKLMFKVKTLY